MAEDAAPTHTAFVKKYFTKSFLSGWKSARDGRIKTFHGMLDRLPVGGFNGYICNVPIDSEPPLPEPERPAEPSDEEDF